MIGGKRSLQNQVSLLRDIQRVDITIDEIESKKKAFPVRKKKIADEIAKLSEEINVLLQEKEELEDKKATIEGDIARADEKLSRNKERLSNIKNDKQYKAVEKESKTANRKKTELTKEVLKTIEFIEAKDGLLNIIEHTCNEKKEEDIEIDIEMEQAISTLENALAEQETIRTDAIAKVTPSLFKRYKLIRSKRHGIGIVATERGVCQGCYMNIPPQLHIQIQSKPDEIISCPHCHRILYFDNNIQN
jgi:uncharacterized protein